MERNCQLSDRPASAYAVAVAQIETADLPAPVYRTARRLLDLAAQYDGDIIVDREEARQLCGSAADGTMRSHLIQPSRAGIIRYHTNGYVSVRFVSFHSGIPESGDVEQPGDNSPDLPPSPTDSRAERSHTRAGRSHPHHPPRAGRSPTRAERSHDDGRALSDHRRAPSDQIRALGDQNAPPLMNVMNGSPIQEDDHSFIQSPAATDQKRAEALLMDVGIDGPMAAKMAAAAPVSEIVRQVAAWLPRYQAKQVGHGSLVKRIFARRHAPDLSPEFLSGELYRRHFPEFAIDEAQSRRRAYLPDDFADLMVG